MITGTILNFIHIIFHGLMYPLLQLGNVSLSPNVTSAITSVRGYLGAVEQLLPIGTLISVFLIVLTTETFIFTYKVVMRIYRMIRG